MWVYGIIFYDHIFFATTQKKHNPLHYNGFKKNLLYFLNPDTLSKTKNHKK